MSIRRSVLHPSFTLLCLGLLTLGCGSREPFAYVHVSGKVTYEDGSPIPVNPLMVVFISESAPVDGRTHPRPGVAVADKEGRFDSVTSHKAGDGLIRGKHKVTLAGVNRAPLPTSIVPAEYGDAAKTPLDVDTSSSPFHLTVRKPAK